MPKVKVELGVLAQKEQEWMDRWLTADCNKVQSDQYRINSEARELQLVINEPSGFQYGFCMAYEANDKRSIVNAEAGYGNSDELNGFLQLFLQKFRPHDYLIMRCAYPDDRPTAYVVVITAESTYTRQLDCMEAALVKEVRYFREGYGEKYCRECRAADCNDDVCRIFHDTCDWDGDEKSFARCKPCVATLLDDAQSCSMDSLDKEK